MHCFCAFLHTDVSKQVWLCVAIRPREEVVLQSSCSVVGCGLTHWYCWKHAAKHENIFHIL